MEHYKMLKTVIKEELKDGEHIWVQPEERYTDVHNPLWWKFDEFTLENIFDTFDGTEWVKRYWHEEGLCIVLKAGYIY